ncbi:MAG: iron-containing alcohol dehydrogenase [Bacteroidales bacterium]|nr:iron-containing alcohol dehydrogenase [Bacteroidales bacterium]
MKATSLPTSITNEPSNSHRSVPLPPAFDFQPLGRVVFGPGSLNSLGELVRLLGGSRVLLVTDPGLETTGHPQRAATRMQEAGLNVFTFDGVKENPTELEVSHGVVFARKHQVNTIVAVGGGSSMDCAKGINFLLTNGGRMIDYKGFGKATKPMLPSVGIPTTTGTGSEAQCYALITDESTHLKMACGDKKAAFRIAILDPELTVSQPRMVTAVTGIDAVAHALESAVCLKRNPISQSASQTAWKYLEPNFERTLTHPHDLAARAGMQLGSHFAGMAIESSMLGVCHSSANPLTAHYGITHGVAIALMLPHVIRFNAACVEPLYAELVDICGEQNGEPASEILARRVTELARIAGLPARLRDVGIAESILPLLAHEANEQWTARFNPRPVGEAEILTIYQEAW